MSVEPADIEYILQAVAPEAFPDDSRFILGLTKSGPLQDHGCYCLDHDQSRLLYTTPGTSDTWRALKFDEAE